MRTFLIVTAVLAAGTAAAQEPKSGTYHCLTDNAPVNDHPGQPATVVFDAATRFLHIDMLDYTVEGTADRFLMKNTGDVTYRLGWGSSFGFVDGELSLSSNAHFVCAVAGT